MYKMLKIVKVDSNYCDYFDLIKIKDGKYGVVNINNMIPVTSSNYSLIDLNVKTNSISEIKYKILLKNQLDYLNTIYFEVLYKSNRLYDLYVNNHLSKNIKDRCCNFPLLEEKCNEYNNSRELQEV